MSSVRARLKLNVLVVTAAAAVLIAGCSGSGGTAGAAAAATPTLAPSAAAASTAPAASSATPGASTAPAAASQTAAAASPSQAAAVGSDPVCDPWLSPAAIESALGAPATKIQGGLLPNPTKADWPKDVVCSWSTTDGGLVRMDVTHDKDDFYVRVKVPGVGGSEVVFVTGLGGLGGIANLYKGQLYIASGFDPAAIIILSGSKGGQPLDQATLVALGKQIPVPPPAQ